jgi:hypothetical protein
MQLPWARQEYLSLLTRTIGTPASGSVFFVQENGMLGFTPAIATGGVLASHFPREHQGPCTLWVTLRALSIEADSEPLRLKIDWNGQWHPGKAEIERACLVSIAD